MRNLHNILLQEDGIEARRLFRLWEKLRLRSSNYKNHRIFTLRCLHNDLIPVSIKLKSIIKSTRAKQILKKAEKELLQARIKSIYFILDNTSRQLEECRSKLATIISTQKLRECQDFVDKVSENRFSKVKQRQINKLNLLTIRKEGNITRSNTNPNNYNHNHNHNSQANRQVISQVPPREDNRSSQAGPPHGEASTSPVPLHASSQAREGGAPPQAGATPIPPGKTPVFPRPVPLPPTLQLSCLHQKTGDPLTPPTPKQVKLIIQQIVLGKVAGNPQGKAPQASQEVHTTSREGNNSTAPPARHPQGSSKEEPNPKWVINLSNKPLTPAQRSVLAKGPNFAVTPRQPPNLEYITAIEAACTKLSQQDAEELRADINRVLRSSHPLNPTLLKTKCQL